MRPHFYTVVAMLMVMFTHPAAAQQSAQPTAGQGGLLQIADRLLDQRRFDEARPIYLNLFETNPRDFRVNRALGFCFALGSRPDYNRAIQHFRAALSVEVSEEVQLELARTYPKAGMAEEGIRILQQLANQHPQHFDHWRDLAAQLDAAGQPVPAIQAYQAYLERRPNDADARVELARLLSVQGNVAEAMSEYQMVLQSNPRSIPGRVGVARLLSWQERFQESLQLYNDVLAASPRNAEAEQGKAQVLLWMDRLDEAEPMLQSLVRRFPDNADIRAALEDIENRRQNAVAEEVPPPPQTPETIESYLARVAANPNDHDAHVWLGEYYANRQDWPRAIEQYRQAVVLLRQDPDQLRLAQLLGWNGEYAEASRILRDLESRNPSPDVELALAAALRWSGRTEEALPLLDKLLQESPDNADALWHRAYAHSALGQFPQAQQDFEHLLALRPDDPEALIGKATAIANQGNLEAALDVLHAAMPRLGGNAEVRQVVERLEMEWKDRQEQAQRAALETGTEADLRQWLEQHPEDADIAYRLGTTASARGDYPQAIYYLQQALDAQPDHRPARLSLAQVLSFSRSYNESVTEYDRLLRQDASDLEPLLESARVLGWAGNYAESIVRYQRYLEANPDLEARLGLARVYMWDGQHEAALREFTGLRQALPDSREVMLERGRMLAYTRRYPQAVEQYDQALASFPDDPEILYAKGQVLYWTGRLEEADRVLSEAHSEAPENEDALFTLASVARARGYTSRALKLIPEDTQHADSQNLRSNILRGLRPELELGFAGEHAKELVDNPLQPDAGLRYYNGNARLSFWMTPEIRAQAEFASTPSFADSGSFLAGLGDSFISNRMMLTVSGQLHPKVHWTLGGGGSQQDSGTENLLYTASLGFQVGSHSALRLQSARSNIDYTPRATALNIRRSEYLVDWSTQISPLTLGATYFRDNYSTGNHSNAGQVRTEVLLPLVRGPELRVGYAYQFLGFTRDFNGGFFTPRRYNLHSVTARLDGQLGISSLRYQLFGSIGAQKTSVFDPNPSLEDYTLSGTSGVTINWDLTETQTLGGGYTFANTALAAGAYRSHGFHVFWRMRF